MSREIGLHFFVDAERVASHMAENPEFLAEVLFSLASDNHLVRDDQRDAFMAMLGASSEIPEGDEPAISGMLRVMADAIDGGGGQT